MKSLQKRQKGASGIVIIIVLAVLGYGAYIGIQYLPQAIEYKAIDTIFSNLVSSHKTEPYSNEEAVREKVIRMLQIDERDDMTDSFSVKQRDNVITIKFSYERELDLVYKKHVIHYEKSQSLD